MQTLDLLQTETQESASITATIVPHDRRSGFLSRYLGSGAFVGEMMLFQIFDRLCASYQGGFWEFVELSNGSMFLYPNLGDVKLDCAWPDNFSSEKVSPEAAGITATLMVLSHLSFRLKGDALEKVCMLYENLREYAYQHPESSSIIALTD